MLIFICTTVIFLEIFVTIKCVKKLIEIEKKVIQVNERLISLGENIIEFFKNIKNIVKKTNKVVKILTNRKIILIHKTLKTTLDIIQIIIYIKSLDFSKGYKILTYKNIKKLLLTSFSLKLIFKLISSVCKPIKI